MDKPFSLSVALAVYNEQDNLAECLTSVKDIASEIVVVDGSSTDSTASIASSYGAQVITEENRTNFHINKQIAIDFCQSPWILQLDADERLSTMSKEEIRKILSSPYDQQPDAFYFRRRNYFLGRWMNKGGMYPDPVIRLFKKGKASLPQASVHELMEVTGVTAWLSEDLLHIADPTFSRYLRRSNRYTSLQAEEWLKTGKLGTNWSTILAYFTLKPLGRFLSIYLRHKGFQDGFPGLVFAFFSGLHLTTSFVKYWEKKTTGKEISINTDWN